MPRPPTHPTRPDDCDKGTNDEKSNPGTNNARTTTLQSYLRMILLGMAVAMMLQAIFCGDSSILNNRRRQQHHSRNTRLKANRHTNNDARRQQQEGGQDDPTTAMAHGRTATTKNTFQWSATRRRIPNLSSIFAAFSSWRFFRSSSPSSQSFDFQVLLSDPEYSSSSGAIQPYVLEEYKLVFFTTPKVGCTTWKLLFRKMTLGKDINDDNFMTMIDHVVSPKMVHDPNHNQLKRLGDYTLDEATHMMTSPKWTRALFVRDPLERFVSAYLDKGVSQSHMENTCCHKNNDDQQDNNQKGGWAFISAAAASSWCVDQINESAQAAFAILKNCSDPHWMPQSKRISAKYLQQVNFLSRLETVQQDSETLLRRIGAWHDFGQTGWGIEHTDRIFTPRLDVPDLQPQQEHEPTTTRRTTRNGGTLRQLDADTSRATVTTTRNTKQTRTNKKIKGALMDLMDGQHHATHASDKMTQHITSLNFYLELLDYYREDYENPIFNFTIPSFDITIST
ncbi:hypothetical protein ACA910_013936 [Epithemia clementina (nom. ined.)]